MINEIQTLLFNESYPSCESCRWITDHTYTKKTLPPDLQNYYDFIFGTDLVKKERLVSVCHSLMQSPDTKKYLRLFDPRVAYKTSKRDQPLYELYDQYDDRGIIADLLDAVAKNPYKTILISRKTEKFDSEIQELHAYEGLSSDVRMKAVFSLFALALQLKDVQ